MIDPAVALEQVATRRLIDIATLHVVESSRGWYCLDIAQWFDSQADFESRIAAVLAALQPLEVPVSAPGLVWMALTTLTYLRRYFPGVVNSGRRLRVALFAGELPL